MNKPIKISKETIKVLKNFANINKTIDINPSEEGDNFTLLRTSTHEHNVFGYAKVAEQFPVRAPIYDLSLLLNVLSQFEDPSIEFGDVNLTIRDASSSSVFWYAPEDLVKTTPELAVIKNKIPTMHVEFDFPEVAYNKMMSMANTLGLNHVIIACRDGIINLVVTDKKNPQAPKFELKVAEYTGEDLEFFFDITTFKILPGDYTFALSKDGISHLKSKTVDGLEYFLATEPK